MQQYALTITEETARRFILGRQGLYPGRRWRGKDGVATALATGTVLQVDPLNVVARSHDIALYGRVLDYRPVHLEELLYTSRDLFDYGGTVMVHPMAELPYWRVVMARKQQEPRRRAFAEANGPLLATVRAAVKDRWPLGARDLAGTAVQTGSFRSGKDTGQALYYLWLAGDLMTHSRRGFDRLYDLREHIAPAPLDYAAAPDAADDFFAHRGFMHLGLATTREWRRWFAGTIARPVATAEAGSRLAALLDAGAILPVGLESDPRTPRYILAEDLPRLAAVHAGDVPADWRPLDTTTAQEMVFLAPLEIVSTRGRAAALFGFEYLWEVYKPQEKRRWGYYTLPILYGDQLVARLDLGLDRPSRTLGIKGFWLEPGITLDDPFAQAFAAGLRRFAAFTGAGTVSLPPGMPPVIVAAVRDLVIPK